jgi:hypothetical protein
MVAQNSREIDTRSNISNNMATRSPGFNGNIVNNKFNYSVRNFPVQNVGFNSNQPVNISYVPKKVVI